VSTSRLESFSDGVIAVAITLLVLDIVVPGHQHATLATNLGKEWPHYAAYVISFITIGIIWVNHHAMVGRLREADHTILMFNLALLLTIGLLPFATSLMARYVNEGGGDAKLGAAVYAGAFLLMSIVFALMNRHILLNRAHLLERELPEARRRQILARSLSGLVPYVLATALAAASPYVSLAICGAVAVFYALPIAQGGADPDASGVT
jgi:uncharacterized membrane protein